MVKIKFYSKKESDPFANVPWQTEQMFACTQEQYDEMVRLTIKNKGILWPEVIEYTIKQEIEANTYEIIRAIENDKNGADAIESLYEKIFKMSDKEKQAMINDLWVSGAPEEYIRSLFYTKDTDRLLLDAGDYSRQILPEPRWPEYIKITKTKPNRKLEPQIEMRLMYWWFYWDKYFDEKPTQKQLIEKLREEYNIVITLKYFRYLIRKNKDLPHV